MYNTASILSKCPAFKHLVEVRLVILQTENQALIRTTMDSGVQVYKVSLPPHLEEFYFRCSGKEGPHWSYRLVDIKRWISETEVVLDMLWPRNRGAFTVEVIATVKMLP